MNTRDQITHVLLWISGVGMGFWFGGNLYESVVLSPNWSASPPASLIKLRQLFHITNPTHFFIPMAPVTVLATVAALIVGWKRAGNRRIWFILSSLCAVVGLAFTGIYFIPRNMILFTEAMDVLTDSEVIAMANEWITASYIRLVILAIGYFSAIRSLSFSIPTE